MVPEHNTWEPTSNLANAGVLILSIGLMQSVHLRLLLQGNAELFELCVFALLAADPLPLCMMLLLCCLLRGCIT